MLEGDTFLFCIFSFLACVFLSQIFFQHTNDNVSECASENAHERLRATHTSEHFYIVFVLILLLQMQHAQLQ